MMPAGAIRVLIHLRPASTEHTSEPLERFSHRLMPAVVSRCTQAGRSSMVT